MSIRFLCHLFHLPGTPGLISKSPVFDLSNVLVCQVDQALVWSNIRYRVPLGHSFCGDWHSRCLLSHCSTRPNPKLRKFTLTFKFIFHEDLLVLRRKKYTFIKGAGAKVEAKVGFSTQYFTPLHKLIRAELVGLGSKPSKLWPSIECQRHSHSFTLFISYLAGL